MTNQKPFFTRFLETQKPAKAQDAKEQRATLKFPSDSDEWWP